jgi:glycerophosphoryl diester phosphodiesterase
VIIVTMEEDENGGSRSRRPEVHGHRGARGLRPENTVPGFGHALALGVDVIELDVGLTADGTVIVNHDQTLSATTLRDTGPAWPGDPLFPYVGRSIRELTLAQIKTVDAGVRRSDDDDPFTLTQLPTPGTRLPTLAEVCSLIGRYDADALELAVELKTDGGWPDADVARFVAEVAKVLDEHGLARRTRLLGFDWRVLTHARRLAPEARRVALIERKTLHPVHPPEHLDVRRLIDAARELGATGFSPERTLVTPRLVQDAHERGLPVTVWTVNDPAEMARFIELGVDAIVSDYPDRLHTALKSQGLPRPTPYRIRDRVR